MPSPSPFARLADLHRELAVVYADLAAQDPTPQADRVVGLAEAAVRLGMTRTWLSRRANWQGVGGYRDADRRIKFTISALAAYIRGRA